VGIDAFPHGRHLEKQVSPEHSLVDRFQMEHLDCVYCVRRPCDKVWSLQRCGMALPLPFVWTECTKNYWSSRDRFY